MKVVGFASSEKILEIKELGVSFGEKSVFSGFSLTMSKGDRIIICGPNGCGKTTLLKCILGLLKQDCGSILAGTDNIAYCKQDFMNTQFPLSVREVVEMGLFKNRIATSGDVERSMEATQITHLADRPFFSLSGGERQRVSLARCFCQKAELLLFDEPSSFLDRASIVSFSDLMKSLPSDISAIVVTHDRGLIENLGWKTVFLKGEDK